MATYVRDGTWRQVGNIYVYTTSWRTVNSAWVYDGSVWKQVHSTGTFQPEIRDAGGTALSYRNVGISMVGYRGYTASATATYQWQYSLDGGSTWTNQTGTNNSGSYAAATLTTNYTTDTTDVNSIENLVLNGNEYFYMRLRVTRSGETQFSQNVRVGKRIPIDASSTLSLLRTSSGLTYTLTGAANERNPYPNDQVFWTPNFTSTTNITNDTRPDYYIFDFTTNSGVTTQDSRVLDVANPRNPLNARRYTVQTSDIGGPIVCDMNAWNSNENAPRTVTVITRPVTTNVLVAPINLVSAYNNGSIVGTWDAASGGNDATINYVAYLFQNGSLIYTSPSSSSTTFSYAISGAGSFRFYVVASQAGNASVTSEYSNTTVVQAPAAFSASITDVTTQYPPGDFSIAAPVLSGSVLNRWDWTWTASTGATVYDSKITRPNGTTSTAFSLTATTDWWTISETGNHTQEVTAKNASTNYVRLSWTKPFGTSAVSYRVFYTRYIGFNGTGVQANVDDVTFLDVTVPYSSDPTFESGNSILLTQVIAYSGPNQTGVQTIATSPSFPNNYSVANKISTKTVSRTDLLTLESPQTGFIYITGTLEPGFTLTMTGTRPVTGTSNWSPAFDAPGWSHVYRWYRSGTVTFQQISGANQSTFSIPLSSTYIGDEIDASVVSTYKGQSFAERFDSTAVGRVTPNPPTFSLTDNGNRSFSISSVNSVGATSYYGSYSGIASGTVGETLIASTFSSPQIPAGTISATLNARRYVNFVYPVTANNQQINSLRSTTNNLSVAVSPQDTGSRRYLNNVYIINPGTFFYISTNGYLGLQSTTAGSNIGIPNDGSWLNMAQADLQQQYLYTLATSSGWWVRWRGNRLGAPSLILEYQVYYEYNTGVCYVNFVENTITDYLSNLAWKSFGGTQSTWLANSSVNTGTNTALISTASMVRNTTNDNADDAVTMIQVIAPAVLMTSNPTVTRTGGGFTFNITDASTGTFDSSATYGSLVISGTATVSINASTGLVTVSGMASSATASVRISKARSGYGSSIIEVTGQALAGLPAAQLTKPTIAGSAGTYSTTKADVGATINAGTGTYNNQTSKTTYIVTALSNTGFNQALSSYGNLGASVTITASAASSSANLYRTIDRVVGTDASISYFISDDQIQAAYPPPTITNSSATSSSITLTFTAYAGASSVYAYKDGVLQSAAATSPYAFTGLSASTAYSLILRSANADGVTSAGTAGGSYSTSAAGTAPAGGAVSLSPSGTVQARTTITANVTAMTGTATITYTTSIRKKTGSAPTSITDGTEVASGTGTGDVATHVITDSEASGTPDQFRAFTTGTNAIGSRTVSSNTVVSTPYVAPVTPAPVLASISGNNSLTLGGTFTWSYTNSPTGYSIFCQGPTGSVFTTNNLYTYTGTSFRPGYDGSGWQGSGNYTLYVSATNAGGSSVVSSQTTFMS